ncbi:MAG: NifU family protein [Myxococcales bacterium]|nr:NifU family protein [Myxococcales bacterium]
MDLGFRMHAERTPNPNSVKWVLGHALVEGGAGAHFDEPVGEGISPLAARLFSVDGVIGVFVAGNFVTVTKTEEMAWSDLAQAVVDAIKAHVNADDPTFGPDYEPRTAGPEGGLADRIRTILETEVRPAVAQDGGDIIFAGYRDGIVEVYLQGSCAGCPSSTMTLKMGIEERLRQEMPEIQEVVAL